MPVSCRLPYELAQRLSEQADAADQRLSDYLRALITDAMAAIERALEAARQEGDRAARVEMNQEIEALRAQLDQVYEAYLSWKGRAEQLEKHIAFTSRGLMEALRLAVYDLPGTRAQVLHYWACMSPDDRVLMVPAVTDRLIDRLEDISEETSTRRFDIDWDLKKIRRIERLLRTLSSEVGSGAAGEARPTADWQPAEAALETAKKAIEERYRLGGESR